MRSARSRARALGSLPARTACRIVRRALARLESPFPRRPATRASVVSPWLTRTTPECSLRADFADASSAEEAASAAEDELRDTVRPFLESNPGVVVARVARVTLAGARVILTWVFKSPDRGEILRDAVASLGPVYVKLGQTLASREDLIGVEASAALRTLQDRMPPFEADAALDLLRAELRVHPDVPLAHPADPRAPFARLSREPIAAASLAQVHKGILRDGRVVAVKIQRPGVYEQVALDMYAAFDSSSRGSGVLEDGHRHTRRRGRSGRGVTPRARFPPRGGQRRRFRATQRRSHAVSSRTSGGS